MTAEPGFGYGSNNGQYVFPAMNDSAMAEKMEADYETGEIVVVIPLNKNRTIVALTPASALCRSFDDDTEAWFNFGDIRRGDPDPEGITLTQE